MGNDIILQESSRKNDKHSRQTAIRDILNKKSGTTHEEIKAFLNARGIKASQATLSRDLREMGVAKVPVNGGRTSYRLNEPDGGFAYKLSNYDISCEIVGNIIVVKTTPGSAPGLCVIIDRQGWSEIAGTVAGDDTILVVVRMPSDAVSLVDKLKGSINF